MQEMVSDMRDFVSGLSNLRILDNKMSGGQYEGNQRGREQHLNKCHISIIAAEYLREGLCVVDPESARRSLGRVRSAV